MSFFRGLSGSNGDSKNLEVIGNNVAQGVTYGAKSARAGITNANAAGTNHAGTNAVGVSFAALAHQFTRRSIATTGCPLDLAIEGSGFFQLTDGVNPPSYSRNGQFKLNKDGFIVNDQQLMLIGLPADAQGAIQSAGSGPLRVPVAGIKPCATSRINVELNLDSRLPTTVPTSGPPIDFNDTTTYNNATSVTVYDAKGQPLALTCYFQKAGTNHWNVYVAANGRSVLDIGASSSVPTPVTTLQFPASGGTPTVPAGTVQVDVPASTQSADAAAHPMICIALDLRGATQYGSAFGVTGLLQNGFGAGQLTGVSVEDDGALMAHYSNGQSKPAGQIELACFRNPQRLTPRGGKLWASAHSAGAPVVGKPGDGDLGMLQAGALEESHVDLTGERISMDTARRMVQTTQQPIRTPDQVWQALVNMR